MGSGHAKQIQKFQKKILSWYTVNKRDLPWRRTHDPYHILISEVMLQQTQVHRVIPKYEAWLKQFPTVQSLAKAEKTEILRMWSGLGYNRRALFLQQTAQQLVNTTFHKEENIPAWPHTIEGWQKFPGIGPYTARAIVCFAFNQQVAMIDANIRKVILIHFVGEHTQRKKSKKISGVLTDKELLQIATLLLPKGRAYDWNQALMDYSSKVLIKEKVPIKKQSTFHNSNRYYRGKLLRILLEKKEVSLNKIGEVLGDTYDSDWREKMLEQMGKEGLIVIENGIVHL